MYYKGAPKKPILIIKAPALPPTPEPSTPRSSRKEALETVSLSSVPGSSTRSIRREATAVTSIDDFNRMEITVLSDGNHNHHATAITTPAATLLLLEVMLIINKY